ncbi:MAG TPA: hypothetical protein VLC52_02615 [Anaerolineae bacterium]|nr:hypothetical protein [Anaerolineae bacterium]
MAFLTQQAMGQPTYVLTDMHQGDAFVQLRYRPHQAAADVIYLAPVPGNSTNAAKAWACLLDGAGIEAAGRGIQRMFANLPPPGMEADLFQQSGFMFYAQEDVYRLAAPAGLGHDHDATGRHDLRAQRAEDWPALQKLFVTITPQRIRQAEGGIGLSIGGENCLRYILPSTNGEEALAALSLHSSRTAHWLRLVVHPGAHDVATTLVHWALQALASHPPRPVYCNVRQYEGGVRAALEAEGFDLYTTRTLAVKHTLAWSKTPVPELLPGLKSSAEAVPPAYHINGESDAPASTGRLAATRDPATDHINQNRFQQVVRGTDAR